MQIESAEKDLNIATAMLHRMQNYHNSATHRIPPEILAMVASHIGDDESLIAATRVCHLWRLTLLSFPFLWTRLTFEDERRTLVYLERSKSAPVSVDLIGDLGSSTDLEPSEMVKETLKGITDRLTTLRVVHTSFLDELLTQDLPILKSLDVITYRGFPSVAFLAPTNLRHLTKFSFKSEVIPFPRIGDEILEFFRNCPLLEVVVLNYEFPDNDPEFATNEAAPIKAVSLPHLRSFTHESPSNTVHIDLFNRLSLQPTCDIAFTVTDEFCKCIDHPWGVGFPALRGQSYLSGVNMVKIAFRALDRNNVMIGVDFFDSKRRTVSHNRLTSAYAYSYSAKIVEKILHFHGSSEIARSVEILHFENCPSPIQEGYGVPDLAGRLLGLGSLKTLVLWQSSVDFFLGDPSPCTVWYPCVENLVICPPKLAHELHILQRVRNIAMSRKNYSTPLKNLSLYLEEEERQGQNSNLIAELQSCVGSLGLFRSNQWGEHRWIRRS